MKLNGCTLVVSPIVVSPKIKWFMQDVWIFPYTPSVVSVPNWTYPLYLTVPTFNRPTHFASPSKTYQFWVTNFMNHLRLYLKLGWFSWLTKNCPKGVDCYHQHSDWARQMSRSDATGIQKMLLKKMISPICGSCYDFFTWTKWKDSHFVWMRGSICLNFSSVSGTLKASTNSIAEDSGFEVQSPHEKLARWWFQFFSPNRFTCGVLS